MLAAVLLSLLSGGVGTLKLDILATDALAVLAAIALPENRVEGVGLQIEGIGDQLVTGEGILIGMVRFNSTPIGKVRGVVKGLYHENTGWGDHKTLTV